MTRFTLMALVLAAGLTPIGRMAAQTPPAQAPPPPSTAAAAASGNVAEGRKLYNSYGCYQCHGYEGQGGVAGPRVGPRPLPLTAFRGYIRRPIGQMPLYTTRIVSDAELGHIHAFLTSLPEPPAVEDLPLLLK